MTQSIQENTTLERVSNNARLFTLLWAYAMVVDTLLILKATDHVTLLIAGLVIVSAIGVVLRPSSLPRVFVFTFLAACQVLNRLPNTPNHWMATLAINLTIAAAGLWVLLREKGSSEPLASAYRHFLPSVRVQLALVYLIAAFHKTNWDYLNPSISCASNMAGNVAALFSLPRTLGEGYPSIVGSLCMEYGIPVLLLIPRTRLLGVAVGLGFHFVLGFDVEIIDSSSVSLRRLAEDHLRIEYFEFRRLGTPLSQLARYVKPMEINAKDFWVEYRRNGKQKRGSRALNPDAEEFQAPPWLVSKVLAFRPVLPNGQPQRCVW